MYNFQLEYTILDRFPTGPSQTYRIVNGVEMIPIGVRLIWLAQIKIICIEVTRIMRHKKMNYFLYFN